MRSGIRGWLGRWMCLAALGFPSTVLAEPGPSPEVPEEPSKVETPETPSSGPETTWWLGTAVGVAAGSGMPRAFLAGGAGVEWGVWWRFAPWYRLGLRNDFFVMQLPWSDREEPALVGASDDPDDPPGVHPELSLSSGLLMTHGFRLGGPAWLELALGPAFLASGSMGWSSILPLPAGGAGIQFEGGRIGSARIHVGVRCDFQVLPHRDSEGDRVLWMPRASVSFAF
ncbi:hypothetical protein KBD49_14935 [Myxococcota bacterium]|nr:hypothetical protein [Myxococcota bacterium]